MKCKHIEKLLSPYVEEELSRDDKRAVEKHVNACESCSLLLSSLEETMVSLVYLPELEVN